MASPGRQQRLGFLALTLATSLCLLSLLANLSGVGSSQARELAVHDRAALAMAPAGTPVAQPDPLDGDPLDGPASPNPLPTPNNASQVEIIQSGRQKDTPKSTVLYDGDTGTTWIPRDASEPWVWFDLGDETRVRNIRWLASGSGEVEIAISSDRERWAVLDTQEVASGWQEIALREDARYVRLTLIPDDEASPVTLAEVEVFAREGRSGVAVAQKAKEQKAKERENKRSKRQKRRNQRAQETAAQDATSGDRDNGGQNGRVNATAKAGKTKCSGKRERCRARPGKVEVTDDCGGNGSCTIDIRADGGSAACDASGGKKNKAGRGEGKRGGGDGGRCEAVADGGTVTIGDINP